MNPVRSRGRTSKHDLHNKKSRLMKILKVIFWALSFKERKYLLTMLAVLLVSSLGRFALALEENSEFVAVRGGAYREGIIGQPVAINPIISANQTDLDISALIYSRLFDLISSYETAENGKAYLVKLKEDLRWENGEPLTSDDVIFTIKTIQDPETRSPLAKNWQGVVTERISELQIQFTLPAPYTFFPNNLKRLPIIPKHIFGNIPAANLRLSTYNLEPVGNGPYRFKALSKRKDGFITQYHLVRNENYHNSKPFINDFYFKFYENNENLLKALKMREINGFGSSLPVDKNSLNSSKLTIEKILMPRYYAIFFNQNINPVLRKADLRYALAAAIDKDRLIEELKNYSIKNTSSPALQEFKNWETERNIPYNPEEARTRINSLDGEKIELNLIVPKIEFLEKTAEIIKTAWLSVGINQVNLFFLSPDELLNDVIKTSNYEMVLFGNILENPLDLFPFWHSSERFYPRLNLALYQNTKVDTLLENIRQTDESEEQLNMLREAEAFILEDSPAIFLFGMPYNYIHSENLKGLRIGAEEEEFLVTPADRFGNIEEWYIASARIIK